MTAQDTSRSIVRLDEGGVNARILARGTPADFRRLEAAGVKIPVTLSSAEAKRLFVRQYSSFQLHAHFLSTIARIRLDDARISRLEQVVRAAVDAATARLDKVMDEAEELFKANGVRQLASYDTVAMEMQVSVLSSLSRRYLEAIVKLDQLMPRLQTLEIYEILTTTEVDHRRAIAKRDLRTIVRDLRATATLLRQEMGPPPAAPAPSSSDLPAQSADPAGNTEGPPVSAEEGRASPADLQLS